MARESRYAVVSLPSAGREAAIALSLTSLEDEERGLRLTLAVGPKEGVAHMPEQQYPTLLAKLVAQSDLTHDEVIKEYEACARRNQENAALSLRTLRRWMAGDISTQPRPAQRRVSLLYWGRSMNELLAPPTTAIAPAQPPSELIIATERDVLLSLERQINMSARRAARFTTYAESSNIGSEAIEQLRHDIVAIANGYLRQPLTVIMGDLVELQDLVFGLLEGKQRPSQTRELYLLASVTTGMVAKASQDLGRYHEAMTLARTAFVCADNADHLGMRAWARNLQSLIAFWAGRPQESVRFAQAGTDLAGSAGGSSVRAWLSSSEARALAQLGATNEARAALAAAADHRDRLRADDLDEIGGLFTFPLAKQHYYASDAYVFLDGAHSDAEREATEAIALYEGGPDEDRAFGDESGARSDLALARIRNGLLDGARVALAPVFDLPSQKRIGGIVTSVNRVHTALRAPEVASSPMARDLRDEIESFGRAPAASITA